MTSLTRDATRHLTRRLQTERANIAGATRQLNTLNPLATLDRGYAIVRKQDKVVTEAAQVTSDDLVEIRVRDGEFTARVE